MNCSQQTLSPENIFLEDVIGIKKANDYNVWVQSLVTAAMKLKSACLLLGRKAMTNLAGTLKSRDINLPTKVWLVKAMVFPIVMYGCESWTIKKAEAEELMLLNCGAWKNSWESPGLQGDPTSPS